MGPDHRADSNNRWSEERGQVTVSVRVRGNVRTNSGELARELLMAGHGVGLRATWDVAEELKSGHLKRVLTDYMGSSNMAIYAVYPCRDFMPAKVNAFIEYLGKLYGNEPSWNRGLKLA